MVKKVKPDNSKTIYVGGIYEVDKASGGSIQRTVTYYPVAGAMRIDSTLYYTLKDHLGSASVVTDASGNVVGENRYYPFGETRLSTGSIFTDRLFTGQREMAGLGIYHYNARFYSPKLGRFLSADTIVPGYANPQNLNRFSYVRNNPLRYTDPTGHYVPCEADAGECHHDPAPSPAPSPTPSPNNCHNDPDCRDENEPEEPLGHDYETENIVCPAVYNCTVEEMQEYATMFQYPGQWWWNPVQDLHTYYVFPAPLLAAQFGNPLLLLTGAIYVDISDDGLALTNFSKPTHIFHEGRVDRTYTQGADGAWTVTTHGTGTNVWPIIGPAIDVANDTVGAPTFDMVDDMMTTYIILDQSGLLP